MFFLKVTTKTLFLFKLRDRILTTPPLGANAALAHYAKLC